MKDWKKKVEKNLGANAAKYVFANAVMEENPHPVIVFNNEALWTTAINKYKNALEKMFPNVVITCRNYGGDK